MNTLVIGHYQESLDWTADLPPGWQPMVVTKDVDVPNEGREPASYLWAIHRLYPRLRKRAAYAFVQGNPFDHCPTLMAELEAGASGFRWLGDTDGYTADATGMPHHGSLPVAQKYRAWTGRPFPGRVTFAQGGQFIVPGRLLTRHPRGFYERLREEACVGEVAWVLERLWEAIFDEKEGTHG